ncbi:trypsin-like serine protease, partial [Photobacterium damselae]|uniref:trypsin-like serine protease n=1 Tax=Photobacterium damselae TaxID=38293 RepID=UPI004068C76B
MKKLLLASLITLASTPALAIKGGTALDWAQHDNLVEMNCTGTIIGGNLVLTADHCKWDSAGGLRPVTLSNGTQVETRKQISSPIPSTDAAYFDIGLWQLASTPKVSAFTPLSPTDVTTGDNVTILGFGKTQQRLNQAVKEITYNYNSIFGTTNINQGVTAPGDSGAPVLQDNRLIGVHNGGRGNIGNEAKLSYKPARDFILNTVNGWHYPTVAKTTNGKADIPIQSLFAENQGTGTIDLANISYDIDTIDGQGTIEFKV